MGFDPATDGHKVHTDGHEQLWDPAGATAKRALLVAGDTWPPSLPGRT